LPIIERLEPDSNVTLQSLSQLLKQASQSATVDDGIEMVSSDEQNTKADSPRLATREKGSNVTSDRFVQQSKQLLGIVSTDEGMQIVCSDWQQSNTDSPKMETFEPGSNLTEKTRQRLNPPAEMAPMSRPIITSRPSPT
jgi:hypothetical protein